MIWSERESCFIDFRLCILYFLDQVICAGVLGKGGYLVMVGLGVVFLVLARRVLLFRLTMRCKMKLVASKVQYMYNI